MKFSRYNADSSATTLFEKTQSLLADTPVHSNTFGDEERDILLTEEQLAAVAPIFKNYEMDIPQSIEIGCSEELASVNSYGHVFPGGRASRIAVTTDSVTKIYSIWQEDEDISDVHVITTALNQTPLALEQHANTSAPIDALGRLASSIATFELSEDLGLHQIEPHEEAALLDTMSLLLSAR